MWQPEDITMIASAVVLVILITNTVSLAVMWEQHYQCKNYASAAVSAALCVANLIAAGLVVSMRG